MRKIFSFNKNLLVTATLFNLLYLNPTTGTAQYAGTGIEQVYHTKGPEIVLDFSQASYITLLCFTCALAFFVFAFIFYVVQNCTALRNYKKNLNRFIPVLLVLSLCTMGASCSPAQKARAEQYAKAMEAQQRTCPMNHHSQHTDPDFNNGYSSTGYYNGYGPVFCKWCGKRISRNNY